MSKIFPIRSQRSNEELFFEYYPQLLKWALQLAHLDRDDAEDLVQDFYLQITHINVVLAEVDAIEPYLFKILRNLHYSRLRRQGKHSQQELSIVDFDSLERGLAAVDRNGLILVHANLARICEFACQRKGRSRAACVFILRFFMGYYSSEVMKIAGMSRMGVDRALQVARSEARRHLDTPGAALKAGVSAPRPSYSSRWSYENLDDSHALFLKLRQSIFNSCEGPCFELKVLQEHYAAETPTRFTAREFAHLVACRVCLDRVNTILGLPKLDERSLDGSIDRDNPPGSGSGQGPGFTITRGKKPDENTRRRKVLERRLREFLEHRPESLELAINGETRTTQRVTAEVSELELKLNRAEEPGFIEVFSQQGVRLAYLHVAEPTSSPDLEQHEHVELSDGRSLDLRLSFANDVSTIRVVYRDPVFAQPILAEDEEDARLLRVAEDRGSFFGTLPTFSTQPTHLSRLSAFCNQCLDLVRPRMNPLLTSAVLLALSSIVCFLLWTRSGPGIPAATLLARAEQSDASVIQSAHAQVIYQKVRMTGTGHAMERAIYRDPQKKRKIKQHSTAEDQWLKDKLNRAGVDWDEPLSAANYSEWRDGLAIKQDVVTRTGYNLLTLTTSTAANGPVARESLTVRESDFHPVERTIELRDAGAVEIAELTYDVMPWGAVNQDWFEPLAGQATARPPAVHPALHLPHLLSELELDEAELAARTTLNQLHADTGEPIHLTREATGIDIKGVVDTNARKRELLSHLVLLSNVHASILSAEEIGTRPQSRSGLGSDQPLQVYAVDAQPSPLERYLREKNLGIDQLATVSHNLLDQGLRISQADVHYFELQPRYKEADQLPEDQQIQLATLSRAYLGTMQAGLDANRQTLLSLGFNSSSQGPALSESAGLEETVDAQIRRYRQLCLELISNGTQASRPAASIAEELINTGDRIRLQLVTASVNVAKDSN